MAKGYSTDLRARGVALVEAGESRREVARLLDLAASTTIPASNARKPPRRNGAGSPMPLRAAVATAVPAAQPMCSYYRAPWHGWLEAFYWFTARYKSLRRRRV